jgi:hypothetical protein
MHIGEARAPSTHLANKLALKWNADSTPLHKVFHPCNYTKLNSTYTCCNPFFKRSTIMCKLLYFIICVAFQKNANICSCQSQSRVVCEMFQGGNATQLWPYKKSQQVLDRYCKKDSVHVQVYLVCHSCGIKYIPYVFCMLSGALGEDVVWPSPVHMFLHILMWYRATNIYT